MLDLQVPPPATVKKVCSFWSFLLGCFLILPTGNAQSKLDKTIRLVDPQATRSTQALYGNLKALSGQKILFGQQDALAYGVTWKNWYKRRSDIHDVSGQHPALVDPKAA